MTTLGEILKRARQAKGVTQRGIAEQLGVTRAAVGQWESGQHLPSTGNLLSLCVALELKPAEVMAFAKATSGLEHVPANERFVAKNGVAASAEQSIIDVPVGMMIFSGRGDLLGDLTDPGLFVERVRFLRDKPRAYAVYIATTDLSPKFELNDILFVEPSMKIAQGGYAIFCFMNESRRKPASVLMIYRGQDQDSYYYSKPLETDIHIVKKNSIAEVHGVVPLGLLFGIEHPYGSERK